MKKFLAAIILAFMILPSSHPMAAAQEDNSQGQGRMRSNPLVEAAVRGDLAAVRALLSQGSDPQAMNEALSGAAANDQIEMVKFLLDKGARLNPGEGGDGAALLQAVEGGYADMVNLLLDKGAQIEVKGQDGVTPLIEAVNKNDIDLVQLLLQRGANLEARDNPGGTALVRAAYAGNIAILQLLLDKGANVNAQLNSGETALHAMAMNGRTEVVKLLLAKGANTEIKDKLGETPLRVAAQWDKPEVAKQLLDHGAKIDTTGEEGFTVLHVAAQRASTAILKMLLDAGAPIEARDKDGMTPLMCAAQAGGVAYADHEEKYPAVDAVNLLLDRGANIEAKNAYGQTALHRAAFLDRPDAIKALLARGANLQATDNHGTTALSLAIVCLRGFERQTAQMPCSQGNSNQKAMNMCQHSVDVMLADKKDVVRVLQEAADQHAPNSFGDFVVDLQNHPRDRARRDHVVELAASLPSLPPIPENAQQRYDRATALMRQASGPQDLSEAMNLLRGALNAAPWWRDAYYQLSRALELNGQYDMAVKNLNYYIELHPPEAEARAACDHLMKIQNMEDAMPKNR
jgi:uncharacterized protein